MIKIKKSIPIKWCGKWIDKNGKQIIIETTKHDFYVVSVLDAKGQPFEIDLFEEKTKPTTKLLSRFINDTNENSILQVEAGINDIGPTYNLYFLTTLDNQIVRPAKKSDDISKVIIRPEVRIGLYNDWEDDLGVPWAFPLEYFKKYPSPPPPSLEK